MPDLWDSNPHSVFSTPVERPDPAHGAHVDHSQEIRLKDDRGRLRLPAYVLIALGFVVVAGRGRDRGRAGRVHPVGFT